MKQSTQSGDTQNGKQPKEVVVQNEPQAKERTSEKIAEENNVGIYQPTRTHEMKPIALGEFSQRDDTNLHAHTR